MSDEIKQPGNVARVVPTNPSRGAGPRKRPRQSPQKPGPQQRKHPPADDEPHRVDEYA